jgi:hypothetical protein
MGDWSEVELNNTFPWGSSAFFDFQVSKLWSLNDVLCEKLYSFCCNFVVLLFDCTFADLFPVIKSIYLKFMGGINGRKSYD